MLSSMVKGIPSLYSTVELFNKYQENTSQRETLYNWSKHYKTTILLNGGVSSDLETLVEEFSERDNFYPWSYFREDESLGNLITAVSIVLPEKIYVTSQLFKTNNFEFDGMYIKCKDTSKVQEEDLELLVRYKSFNDFEQNLVYNLSKYRLAT